LVFAVISLAKLNFVGSKIMRDFEQKLNSLRNIMLEKNLEGILITRQNNFSWLTGGRSHINIASDLSICKLLVTFNDIYLIINNVDAPLILEEEINKIEVLTKTFQWYEAENEKKYVEELLASGVYGTDFKTHKAKCISDDLYTLRTVLSAQEIENYRHLGQDCANVLEDVCKNIKLGESELQIAGKLTGKLYFNNIVPIVILIAADERAFKYRHPLPTHKNLDKYVILSICGRRNGLITAVTRIVHFGKLSKELSDKRDAIIEIDANYIHNTRPGEKVKDIFKNAIKNYKKAGYEGEWRSHFQGGIIGYNTREHKASLDSKEIVKFNQAYAWNPSISGIKSEDTFLVLENGNEIITETDKFPYCTIKINDSVIKRPDIMIRSR
jgi:Xaa-Pro dipeptidase